MMELDLRSFLPSLSDADDAADDETPHRTIDEILNDCDTSSSSSSSPSPPSSPSHLPQTKLAQFPQPEPVSTSRVKLTESTDPTRPPRPFSSLLGRVRPNAKPGAALAAAAAASRSVPTPHAAAIMSKRKIAALERIDSGEIAASGDDDVSDVSSKGGELEGKMDSVDSKVGSSESSSSVDADIFVATEVNVLKKKDGSADFQVINDSTIVSEEKRDLDECSVSPSLNEVENFHDREVGVNSSPFDGDHGFGEKTSLCNVDVGDDGFGEKTSFHNIDVGDKDFGEKISLYHIGVGDDDKGIVTETEALVNGDVVGGVEGIRNEVNDGGGGDDGSSIGDVYELVEEKLEELESKMAANSAEEKPESPKKPLDVAEELEKKNASTGLHLEEGAAAQPMRLEGVRRGSITLGYFDVEADNAVTRAISSQNFRREHGSAQVLAVHANYIAAGMTKGLIIVVPSKYSIHHADNNDGKVLS